MLKAILAMVFFIILKVMSHHESMHGRITYLFTILFRQSTELQLPSQLVEYGNSLANNGEK